MSIRAMAIAVVITAVSNAADAQVVQQPVVSGFSVDTVVSVPDRGGVFRRGLERSVRRPFGGAPLVEPSSTGRSFQGAATETRVFIHDFEAMDAALLSQGQPVPAGHAAHSGLAAAGPVSVGPVAIRPASSPPSPITRADRGAGPSAGAAGRIGPPRLPLR